MNLIQEIIDGFTNPTPDEIKGYIAMVAIGLLVMFADALAVLI